MGEGIDIVHERIEEKEDRVRGIRIGRKERERGRANCKRPKQEQTSPCYQLSIMNRQRGKRSRREGMKGIYAVQEARAGSVHKHNRSFSQGGIVLNRFVCVRACELSCVTGFEIGGASGRRVASR